MNISNQEIHGAGAEAERSEFDLTSAYHGGVNAIEDSLRRNSGRGIVLRLAVTEFDIRKAKLLMQYGGEKKIILRGSEEQRQEFDRKFSDYASIVEWEIGNLP